MSEDSGVDVKSELEPSEQADYQAVERTELSLIPIMPLQPQIHQNYITTYELVTDTDGNLQINAYEAEDVADVQE